MSSTSAFARNSCCTLFLEYKTQFATKEEIAALSNLRDLKKEGNKIVEIFLILVDEIEEIHIAYQNLVKDFLGVSSVLKIVVTYLVEAKFSKNVTQFLEEIFSLVGSGKTKVEEIMLWDYSEYAAERINPIYDSFQTGIHRMLSSPGSSLRGMRLVGIGNYSEKVELNIAKAAMHHESRFEQLYVYPEELFDGRLSEVLYASVRTREKRKSAVLVCCVLRACEGAPHFMDLILHIANLVGDID